LRAALTAGLLALAVWAGRALSFTEQVWAMFVGFSTGALASGWLIIADPSRGKAPANIDGTDFVFQGIYANRNSLAPVCALSLVAAVAVSRLERNALIRAACALVVLLDVWLLVGAESITAIAGVVAAVAAGGMVWLSTSLGRHTLARVIVVGVGGGLTALGVLIWTSTGWIDRLPGGTRALSGRDEIWAGIRPIVRDRLWTGHGFWSFWESPAAQDLYAQLLLYYGSAHNSYLETVVGMGLVGLASMLAMVALSVSGVARIPEDRISTEMVFWVAVLAVTLSELLTESFVTWYSAVWFVLVMCGAAAWAAASAERA
jgi:O-antigen ligase